MSARGTRIAKYTDGTLVNGGDSIRSKQSPGGLLPPSLNWDYGIAARLPNAPELEILDPDELYLRTPEGRYYYIVSHIVERVSPTDKEI